MTDRRRSAGPVAQGADASEESGDGGATRLAAFAAGPILSLLVAWLPFASLSPDAHRLAAILSCVVVYWIAEPIPLPMTALLGTSAAVLFGLGTAKSIFAAYAHPIIFLFIGSFFLAEALAVHGVDRRFALWMLSLPWVAGRPSRILMALGTVTAVISMWISNTAATALALPIALGVVNALEQSSSGNFAAFRAGLLLMLSYAATAGGVATVIGTPPNLIGVGLIAQQAKVTISFVTWMVFGLPLAVVMLFISWRLLWLVFRPATDVLPDLAQFFRTQRATLGPWTAGQRHACLAFVLALIFWVGPGLLEAALGETHPLPQWFNAHLPNELVALLAAGLLFFLPTDWRTGAFALSWKQATSISWGTILLFGGGLAFGELMVKTGLAQAIGTGFVAFFGVTELWSLTAVAIVVAVLVSELASNTASASMLIPVVIAIAQTAGVSPVPPALGVCLAASLGFALPVSTPPNAIIYGTGLVPMRSMIRTGLVFDLIGSLVIWLTLRLLCPFLGLA